MKKLFFFLSVILFILFISPVNLNAQQIELKATNIRFESSNSLTFDVYIHNKGTTSVSFSNAALVWTYDPAFLNGGNLSFTLVSGYNDFPSSASPPSTLITTPNIIRTSSNMPGSNGDILPGEQKRLSRFRFQTSAPSFSGTYFNLNWKTSIVPFSRIFVWNNGTGLPEELSALSFSVEQLFFEENFSYTTGQLTTVSSGNWINFSGTGNFIQVVDSSLNYPGYLSSGIGNKINIVNSSSSSEDAYRSFTTQGDSTITYAAFLVNVSNLTGLLANTSTTGDHFVSYLPSTSTSTFNTRVSIRLGSTANTFNLGLRASSSNTSSVWYPVDLNLNTNYQIGRAHV